MLSFTGLLQPGFIDNMSVVRTICGTILGFILFRHHIVVNPSNARDKSRFYFALKIRFQLLAI